ncbi:MAG: hypothetical protein A2792_15700 [Sphingomonadales bacterium RIFCSPHIGHO2_01_FULL_65_20]|jgi:UTP:GlnB (protein PII) uridylyltransferase|nr:MAG: hypothetical protein A2792_15700 [Sphingomonadales bacterium RIFCSPHIGHO2_01_FULL_65_20]
MTGASHLPDLGDITEEAPAEILNRQQGRHDARLDHYVSMCRDCRRINRRGALVAVAGQGLGRRILEPLSVNRDFLVLHPQDQQLFVKKVSSTNFRA